MEAVTGLCFAATLSLLHGPAGGDKHADTCMQRSAPVLPYLSCIWVEQDPVQRFVEAACGRSQSPHLQSGRVVLARAAAWSPVSSCMH
jgi:hypothetical protein